MGVRVLGIAKAKLYARNVLNKSTEAFFIVAGRDFLPSIHAPSGERLPAEILNFVYNY